MKLLPLVMLVACAPPYVVIRASAPFAVPCAAALDRVDFAHLQVGGLSQDEWLSKKAGDQQSSWEEDKHRFAEGLASAVFERAPAFVTHDGQQAPYIAQPHVLFYEPGFYAYAVARPTEVDMDWVIVDAHSHKEVEVVRSRAVVGASIYNPSSGGRFKEAGRVLGLRLGRYLADRCSH